MDNKLEKLRQHLKNKLSKTTNDTENINDDLESYGKQYSKLQEKIKTSSFKNVPKRPPVVEFEQKCPGCNKVYKVFTKFVLCNDCYLRNK